MTEYRLYFWAAGRIVGRHDFIVEDDEAARVISGQLFDACSDGCEAYDLWSGQRYVPVASPRPRALSFEELNAVHQATIVEVEETISRSNWMIAHSRRLLDALDGRRKPRA